MAIPVHATDIWTLMLSIYTDYLSHSVYRVYSEIGWLCRLYPVYCILARGVLGNVVIPS